MKLNTSEIKDAIIDVLKAGLVPFIASSPGCGKSDIVRNIAKEFDLFLIDLRLASKDPTDISGFPTLTEDRTRSQYSPPLYFPIEEDEIPKGYKGFLLFLDEMNSANNSVQAAAYQVVLDKAVGQHKLHEKCMVVAAGNLASDKAIVNRLSTAMQSRMIHLPMEVDNDSWENWAYKNNIDYRIRSFIKFRPELLHKFDPNHNDLTFACPRTWEFLSKIIINWEEIPLGKLHVIAGTVSQGVALEFMSYVEIMEELPDFSHIMKYAATLNIPTDPSIIHALTQLISHKATASNIDTLMLLVNRFDIEFQIICLKDIVKHKKDLLENNSIEDWISKHQTEIAEQYA